MSLIPARPPAVELGTALTRHTAAAETTIMEHAETLASETATPLARALSLLLGEIKRRFSVRTTDGVEFDNRAALWQIRVRLYSATDSYAEPEADSDPDLSAEQAGVTILRGLPAVGDEVATLAKAFHQAQVLGLESDMVRHRIKGLRPTISRRGGNAVWRIPYQVKDRAGGYVDWLARVDLQRVSTGE